MNRVLFLAPFLLACGGSHATSLTKASPVPPFLFYGATQNEQEAALAIWEKESACIGLDPAKAHLVPFTVLEGQDLYCGKVLAAGCTTTLPSVTVRREWFSLNQCIPGYGPGDCHAAATELLHLALLLHGEDWGYQNVAFQRCL